MKYLYIIDHFVPFPRSEYGGQWSVVADNDEQCLRYFFREDFDNETFVSIKLNIVAMLGSIIPAPLHIPLNVIFFFPIWYDFEIYFGYL